ncbi:hotdog family protein [Lichenicoccus roseus]|uniref:Phosphotransferase n=1 Tax=Lichenicoccus roseus TaxID=2683649 RepID=A0A5R9JEN7_9PROT|nr:phosphotransferase [Lichenicoccus roseus]TLU74101.1 phosphotransferase [Lichenicoccus roseus]
MTRDGILALIPHQGAMCMLDRVLDWNADRITCESAAHLSDANPLRREGRLGIVCGAEFAFQAAALHGALLAGGVPQRAGYVAAMRLTLVGADRLDDTRFGLLKISSMLELNDPGGLIYGFALQAEDGTALLQGRGTIAFPA